MGPIKGEISAPVATILPKSLPSLFPEAITWDFQQCGILTCVDSDQPV